MHVYLRNDVSFHASVLLFIMNFCHNIIKVAVDPQGESQVVIRRLL